jgi:hypothetical protein
MEAAILKALNQLIHGLVLLHQKKGSDLAASGAANGVVRL